MQNGANTLRSLTLFVSSHFMFNVLGKLQSEILSGEKRKAISTLSLYSKLIRQACKISEMESITLAEEEVFLKTYCDTEQERFSESPFTISFTGFDEIDITLEPFLIQPFIELAILGGLGHKSHDVKIEFNRNENSINIHSVLLNRDVEEKINEKTEAAMQRLSFFHHTFERSEVNGITMQKIILFQ